MSREVRPDQYVRFSSELMENYAGCVPVSGGQPFQAVAGRGGEVELLGLGTDGQLYYLQREASLSGWRARSIGRASSFRADGLGDGTILVFALTADGQAWFSRGTPEAPLGHLERIEELTLKSVEDYSLRLFSDGGAVVLAEAQGAPLKRVLYDSGAAAWSHWGSVASYPNRSHEVGMASVLDGQDQVQFLVCTTDGAVCALRFYSDDLQDDDRGIWDYLPRTSTTSRSTLEIAWSAPVLAADGSLVVLGYCAHDGRVYRQRQVGLRWETAWTPVGALDAAPVDLLAGRDARGRIDLFALDKEQTVEVMRELQPDGTAVREALAIETHATGISLANRADGSLVGFVSTIDDQLLQCTQQEDSTLWVAAAVALPSPEVAVPIRSYTCELGILGERQAPRPGAVVRLTAPGVMPVLANGHGQVLSPDVPCELRADGAARVGLTYVARDLSGPVFRVWHDGMPEGQVVEVQSNDALQTRLEGLTAERLLEARTHDGQQVLQGAARTGNVPGALADAVVQCMSLARTPTARSEPVVVYAPRSSRNPAARVVQASSPFTLHRIDPRRVPEQRWILEASDGTPTFRTLRPAEARAHVERTFENHRRFELPSLGDLIAFIEQTGARITSVLVDTVVDAATALVSKIQSVVTFVHEGLDYVFDGVIELIEQAFQLVHAVFATVLVGFQVLFEWLGYFFDWDDILRTKDALTFTVEQILLLVESTLDLVEEQSVRQVNGLTDKLDGLLAWLESTEWGQTSLQSLVTQHRREVVSDARELAPVAAHNLFLNGFLDQVEEIENSPAEGDTFSDEVIDAFREAFSQAIAEVEAVPRGPHGSVPPALAALAEDPWLLYTQPFAEAIRGLRAVIDPALEMAEEAVETLFRTAAAVLRAIRSILTAPWKVPVLSPLYARLTATSQAGSGALTPLNLAAMIVAAPATVAVKAARGKAPFPTAAALDAYKAQYNVHALRVQSGLDPSPRSPTSSRADDALYPRAAPIFFALRSSALITSIPFAWILDIAMVTDEDRSSVIDPLKKLVPRAARLKTYASVMSFGLNLFVAVSKAPWLTQPGDQPLIPANTGKAKANWGWIVCSTIFDLLIPGVTLARKGSLPQNMGDLMPFLASAMGWVRLVLGLSIDAERGFPNPADTACGALACVPQGAKFLGHSVCVQPSQGKSVVALCLIDVAGYAASSGLSLESALTVETQ